MSPFRSIWDDIATPVDNAFRAVGDAGSYAAGALTGNQQAQNNASQAFDNAVHNTVTTAAPAANFVGSAVQFIPQAAENYANTFANLGNSLSGAPQQTIQQNLGGNAFLDKTLSASGATGSGRQLAGDAAQIGLSAAAGGIESFGRKAAASAAGAGIIGKTAAKVGSGALINSGFNTSNYLGNAQDPTLAGTAEAAKSGLEQGAALGGLASIPGLARTSVGSLTSDIKPAYADYQPGSDANGVSSSSGEQTTQDIGQHSPESQVPAYSSTSLDAPTPKFSVTTGPDGKPIIMHGDQPLAAPPDFLAPQETSTMLSHPDALSTSDRANQGLQTVPEYQLANGLMNRDEHTTYGDNSPYAENMQSPISGRSVNMPAEVGTPPVKPSVDYQNNGSKSLSPAGRGNMINITDKRAGQVARDADLAGKSEVVNLSQRNAIIDRALQSAYKTPQEGRLLLESVEHPEDLQTNLSKIPESQRGSFEAAVNGFHDMGQYVESSHDRLGAPIEHRQNYLSHNVDTSNFDEDFPASTKNGATPNYGMARKYGDLRELYAAGQKLKYEDPRDLLKDYVNRASQNLYRNAFLKEVDESAPGHVGNIQDGQAVDDNGRRFATGRSNGLSANTFSDQMTKAINKYVEPHDLGVGFRTVDTIAQSLKQSTLALGGFHDVNLSYRNAAQELGSAIFGEPGRALNIITHQFKGDAAFWSKEAFSHYMDDYRQSGLLDRARDLRMTIGENADVGRLGDKGDARTTPNEIKTVKIVSDKIRAAADVPHKVNEFLHSFLFQRKIPVLKMETLKAELNRAGIPLRGKLTPEQIQEGRALAQQIDNTYGGINAGAIAHTVLGKQLQRLVMLSPDFTGGNINSALTTFKGGAAGSLARRQNITNITSKILIQFIAAGGGAAGIAAVKNTLDPTSGQFLDPKIKLPFKNAKGEQQVGTLPGSPIEEAAKLRDPAHFIQSRGSAFVSDAAQMLSGKNYYGEPLLDPRITSNPSLAQKLGTVLQGNLPIGITRALSAKNGANNLPTAGLDIAGVRVGTDPNDPQYLQAQNHYTQVAAAKASIPGTDKQTQDEFAAYLDRNSRPNPDGSFTGIQLTDSQKKSQAQNLYGNDKLRQVVSNYQKAQNSNDPLYQLSDEQQKVYYQYQSKASGDGERTVIKEQNPFLQQFISDRNSYYKDNQIQGTSIDPNPKYPTIDPDTQTKLDQITQLSSITNKTAEQKNAESALYNDPGVIAAQRALHDYMNATRQATGDLALKGAPQIDPDTQKAYQDYLSLPSHDGKKGGSPERAAWIKSNPDVYAKIQSFLAAENLYKLDKNASLDIYEGQKPNQAELGAVYSLGKYDVAQGKDAAGNINYAVDSGLARNGGTSGGFTYSPASNSGSNYKQSGGGNGNGGFFSQNGGTNLLGENLRTTVGYDTRHNKTVKIISPGKMQDARGLYTQGANYAKLKGRTLHIKSPRVTVKSKI